MKFSVIIATYNRCEKLPCILASLLAQNYDKNEYEIIVISDGSTDKTDEILREYTQNHALVRLLQTPHAGVAVARNAGIHLARGEYLAIIDDDCSAPPNWLSSLESAMQTLRADAAGGRAVNMLPDDRFARTYQVMHEFFQETLRADDGTTLYITTNNFVCKKSIFLESGAFDERFFYGGEDRELIVRMIDKGYSVAFLPDISIEHYHTFSFASFLGYFHSMGQGSFRLRRITAGRKHSFIRHFSLWNYLLLFAELYRDGRNFGESLVQVALGFLAQSSVVLGYIRACTLQRKKVE